MKTFRLNRLFNAESKRCLDVAVDHGFFNELSFLSGIEDLAQAVHTLVKANPEVLVWGGDWPHPRVEGEMPDAGHLFELFQAWTPDTATQHRILVSNPAKLYGFPN